MKRISTVLALVAAIAIPRSAAAEAPAQQEITIATGSAPLMPADRIAAGAPAPLRSLLEEVLGRNPDLASAAARARAAEQKIPQARSLPDPMASIAPFLMSPETRVGPQQAMMSLAQRLPWFGKLGLREQAAFYGAAAARADLEAKRLAIVTEAQRLYYELAFLEAWDEAVRLDRETLLHYEELARQRYAAGSGLQQAVVKLQAEATKDDSRLLEIANRRATIASSINALRDLPDGAPLEKIHLPDGNLVAPELERWRRAALGARPEMTRVEAELGQARTMVELAKKEYEPDFTVGLTYTIVGPRQDVDAGMAPPDGNGDDVFGVSAGVNLPIWRERLEAGVEEAIQRRNAAEEMRRGVVASIDAALAELSQRIELTHRQIELFENVLLVQAEQSLRSAEAAYGAGNLGALDLLDAQRILLDVRTSTARARADYAIALARLSGTLADPIAAPLLASLEEEDHD